ncbi:MAG: MerR family transcriptional regulator [Oscillospiraceae bacterium]|nr:MerR family transcriptional regulator [Oscillospiraceae bacterium]
MKINEVEQRLEITKANIRFYEKEGLNTPARTEKGYRDYSEEDIRRLKEIIILRKLGIPVQQIADILDGALPLQEALDANISALQAEIEKLNGSLELCRQLKREDARMLDTERYWEIIHDKEQEGFRFQTLAQDYISFVDQHIRSSYFIPEEHRQNTRKVIKYVFLYCVCYSLIQASTGWGGEDFATAFGHRMGFWLSLEFLFPFVIGLFVVPALIIGRKSKKYGKIVEYIMKTLLALLILYFGMRKIFT